MIRVVKPAPPDVLVTKGSRAAQACCAAFDAAPDDYKTGTKVFAFDGSIYAAPAVKEALHDAQHRKCAFCESFFAHTGYGDVEHFRPKAGHKQRESDVLRRPGYYWLAYEWGNLFYSCQLCNQRFKRNLFPLKDARHRARTHRHRIKNEKPLLVDPSACEPSDFLEFRDEYAFAVKGCREGEVTIEVLGLNREELVEVRRDRLATLKQLIKTRDFLRQHVRSRQRVRSAGDHAFVEHLAEMEELLRARTDSSGEYAAMTRALLRAVDG